jgi:putative transcriptional regulator
MIKAKPKNKIKEFREGKRMKQTALASKVGIFQSEISEIETGERKPNIYLAKKIVKVLGKTIDDIFLP